MNFFKTKYRIVSDNFAGFEAQFKVWWFPFWIQCFGVNTRATLESAIEVCKRHSKRTKTIQKASFNF